MRPTWSFQLKAAPIFLISIALAGCTGTTGDDPAAGGTKRIIIVSNSAAPFWDAIRAGWTAAEKDLNLNAHGLRVAMQLAKETEDQIRFLRQLETQSDVAGVAISAVEASNLALAKEMKRLQAKGIPVITLDSDMDRQKYRDARLAFIGTDNLSAGRQLGIAAKHLLSEGGGFVTFVGVKTSQNAIERVGGFEEGAGSRFTLLDNMGDGTDTLKMRKNVQNAILNHKEKLKALVGIWSQNTPAIVDVLRKQGNRDRFKVLAFDAEALTIKAMGEGYVDAMIVQNPYQMGYQSVRLLKALITADEATKKEMFPNLGQPDGDLYDTGLKIVVPDEGSPLDGSMFGEKTEFYKLGAFRRWLEELGLTGS